MVPSYPSITRLFGLELEFFLVDKKGNISNKADLVINNMKKKLVGSEITTESGKSMVELKTFPSRSSRGIFGDFFNDLKTFLYELDVNDLKPFYYGTYPGKNTSEKRIEPRYKVKENILGSEQWPIAQRCIGFHHHYTLPRNSINPNFNFFYPDLNNVKQEKIVNLYNLYTALDPAVTTFMQSSPYNEGKLMGKDSRVMLYRGDTIFSPLNMLYLNQPEFGVLEDYIPDFPSLIDRIKQKSGKWQKLLRYQGYDYNNFAKKDSKPSFLDSGWNPVKISPHCTIESRGADMNSLCKIVALSTLLKALSKYVQNNHIKIKPGLTGIKEPFKLENDVIHVPEFTHLKTRLQYNSALKGMDDKETYNYCKSLLKLAKKILSVESRAPLRVFSKMIYDKKTTSDDIISFVRKRQGSYKNIEEETAKELAVKAGEDIYKDLIITEQMIEKNFVPY